MSIGILGGGLAGVSLQRFTSRPSEVLEASDRPGGLCRSWGPEGWTFDVGGHILFSKDASVLDTFRGVLGDNLHACRRANQVLYRDRFVKYPFENGLSVLDREEILDCLLGFLENPHPAPANFREWLLHTFGDGLCGKYLLPYNEKIWKVDLATMGLEWVERVPKPPLADVLRSALGIETEGYVHQLNFLYPTRGGIEALVRGFMAHDRAAVATGAEVTGLRRRPDGWEVATASGAARHYERLVVACPVDKAVGWLPDVPDEVRAAAAGLVRNTVRVVLVGACNESLLDKSAVYIPDPTVLPHRVCYMAFFSRHNAPPGCSSLIAEVTARPGSEWDVASDAAVTERVVADLDRIGFVRRGDVVVTEVRNEPYGYPVYDLRHARNQRVLREYFAGLGIDLLGRWGEWDYINMDEVVRRSRALAARLDG
ncbi:MAG: FAD-dependent oxidoreductase [Deltaproteobacteria bacterium]|nr:FAD-dependent oxidoreductase [Deltaproteobacteria bacterium]